MYYIFEILNHIYCILINLSCFIHVGNYKKTVKRIDDGAIMCDELLRMVGERAEIEAKYARKLTAWEEKWKKQV